MNRLLTILGQSLRAVRSFKLRTSFCLVSIALGIASITIIVAATEGAYKKAYDIIDMFGPDSVLVISGSDEARAIGLRPKTITLEDVQAVRDAFPTAYMVVPMSAMLGVDVSFRNNKLQTRILGSTSEYGRAWSWPVVQGSDLSDEDVKGLRNVALIGQYLQRELFGDADPVGKYVQIKGLPVQVVGVLMERGTAPGGDNMDDRLVMPITTLMKKLQNENRYVGLFRVRFQDQPNLNRHAEDLQKFMRQRHRIPEGEPDDFRVISPKEIILFLVAITGSLVVFLGITGVIALVVAGFVLANLFLLSVQERTKEIGIRRAVGARRRDILLQFLGESLVITTAGGLAGFVLGYFSSALLTLIADFPIHFSWKAFAIGLVLSCLVGIGFGLQPASRAAHLNPIEAIRQ
jgi:putative ABC transport system permease protein